MIRDNDKLLYSAVGEDFSIIPLPFYSVARFALENPKSNHLLSSIVAAESGDPDTTVRLLPLRNRELRNLAGSLMAQFPPGQTLQVTTEVDSETPNGPSHGS